MTAARSFVSANKALFRLSDQGVSNLELLNDSPLAGSDGHAVLFRQTFGGLPATQDGLITVGVVDGKIAYVSSSSAGDGSAPAAAVLGPQEAWLRAAAGVGLNLSVFDVSAGKNVNGWLTFRAAGLNDLQRVRLVAMPTPADGVQPAYEAIVLDVRNTGAASAYTVFVDAVNGNVLFRHNDVQQAASLDSGSTCESTGHACAYQGTMTGTSPGQCGPAHGPYPAPANTKSIDAAANADVATNDIELDLLDSSLNVVTSSDVATSPEAVHYEPTGGIAAGTVFYTQVCPSPAPAGPFVAPLSYHGSLAFNDVAGTQPPLVMT